MVEQKARGICVWGKGENLGKFESHILRRGQLQLINYKKSPRKKMLNIKTIKEQIKHNPCS